VKDGTKLLRCARVVAGRRRPALVSAGPALKDSALPTTDIGDVHTLLAGAAKRFATRPPERDPEVARKLKAFVRTWVRKNVAQLAPDSDTSFETWLKKTDYTEARKAELTLIWNTRDKALSKKDRRVKMFMKNESYTDYKHGRAINSRSDRFKVEVGPIFKLIEEQLFKLPWFIKKVPVAERAKYVYDRLYAPGAKYVATDYTSFEALFTKGLMEDVEFELYDWVTEQMPEHDDFMATVRSTLGGTNTIVNKNLTLEVEATRMSGEMCTSLGNGFSNLMFMLFVCDQIGSKVIGVVEGDDGLFRIIGRIPDTSMFEELGLLLKMEIHDHLNTASFCGQIFDIDTMTVITDPKKVLASFGWIDGKYALSKMTRKLGMLRAKAWSVGYQYPACPILSSLARCYLRLTRSIDARVALNDPSLSSYQRGKLKEMFDTGRPELNKGIAPATRELMHTVFGISPELQRRYEHYFDELQQIEEIPRWFDVPCSWVDYRSRYGAVTSYRVLINDPPENWLRIYPAPLPDPLHAAAVEYRAQFSVA